MLTGAGGGVAAAPGSAGLIERGGSAEGTAVGAAMGTVSTPGAGSTTLPEGGEPVLVPGAACGIGTGTAARCGLSPQRGILGALGRLGFICVAAGTCTSFLRETGRKAVAAPVGLGVARAASARRSESESAWYASHCARLSSRASRLVTA